MAFVPPLAFVLFLLIALILGAGGRKLAPKVPPDSEAATSYAGGEDIPGEKKFVGYKVFFPIALFFTVLHVLALLLGLLPQGLAWVGLVYSGIIVLALLSIILR
ncbi:MAG: hypothetical protein NUV68_01650 [Caldiserica bacterium]|jgi:NADH:ubiquinone oxidoreductase subunit 3 (subunit A)|nr:hypothetical protein [Caldisericota bacterium]MDH7562062.1 hypothetical protein [Caldisericota bacterium]